MKNSSMDDLRASPAAAKAVSDEARRVLAAMSPVGPPEPFPQATNAPPIQIPESSFPETLTTHEYMLARYWWEQAADASAHQRQLVVVPPHEMQLLCESLLRLDPLRGHRSKTETTVPKPQGPDVRLWKEVGPFPPKP